MINNLPKTFLEKLSLIYNPKDIEIIINWFKTERVTSLRINTLKSDQDEIEMFFTKNNISFEKIKFLPYTYIIDKKHEYFLKWSRIFYDGKIYIQWIASQIPATLLELQKWDKVLDLTAAPWSKTTQISAILENTGEIIAIEQNQIRFDKLNYNIKLQWCTNVKAIKTDANKIKNLFKNETFDKIIFDAPCSAEWKIDLNNEKTYWFWSEENILNKQKIQKEIIDNTINLLKKWWIFIYSTCTLSPEENEEIIDYILNNYPDFKVEKICLDFEFVRNGITEFNSKKYNKEVIKSIRVLLSKISEGFFICKMKKI